jgi:hypothetical protein
VELHVQLTRKGKAIETAAAKVLTGGDVEIHQQRVVDELKELETRRVRLGTFIRENPTFKTLPQPEQNRLTKQLRIMLDYEEILNERIAEFPKK